MTGETKRPKLIKEFVRSRNRFAGYAKLNGGILLYWPEVYARRQSCRDCLLEFWFWISQVCEPLVQVSVANKNTEQIRIDWKRSDLVKFDRLHHRNLVVAFALV